MYSFHEYPEFCDSTGRADETAEKQLRRVPQHVSDKLLAWVKSVETRGLDEVRKIPGYHDEPLKGQRAGQRSIRLSGAYRAFYVITVAGVEVSVIEVNKHEH